MIKKSVFEDDLIAGMQRELQAYDKKQGMQNLVKAADYLHSAMGILEEAGLSVQSEQVFNILSKIAATSEHKPGETIEFKSILKDPKKHEHKKHEPSEEIEFKSLLKSDKSKADDADASGMPPKVHDPHTKGLTPDKMVENYKNHGIPFNLTDDGLADDLLNVDIDDEAIEIIEHPLGQSDFEDEKD